MISKLWRFTALDTLFFRDGTSYNAGEGGQGQVTGGFPPFMTTMQGAVRTALAYGQGWTPDKPDRWPVELGDPDDPGQLIFRGPYLFHNEDVLFPAPLLYRQKKQGRDITCTRLLPGDYIKCDLGGVRLPRQAAQLEGAKSPEGQWLKNSGLEKVLAGMEPDNEDIVEAYDLWRLESRIGIKLEYATRTAEDKKIYSCVQARPNANISLGVILTGVPEEWHARVPPVIHLGGEGRLAGIEISELKIQLLPAPILDTDGGKLYFTVILLTPGFYKNLPDVIKNGPPGIPGTCIAACIGKVRQVGGWDIINRCPRPLEPLLPAGSAWFFEADEKDKENLISLHGRCLGSKTEYGFGQIVIGCWRDKK